MGVSVKWNEHSGAGGSGIPADFPIRTYAVHETRRGFSAQIMQFLGSLTPPPAPSLKFGLFGAAARKSPKPAPAGQKEHKENVFRCGEAAATKNHHLCGHIDSPLLGRESGQVGRIANPTYLQGNSGQKAKVQGRGCRRRRRGSLTPPPTPSPLLAFGQERGGGAAEGGGGGVRRPGGLRSIGNAPRKFPNWSLAILKITPKAEEWDADFRRLRPQIL